MIVVINPSGAGGHSFAGLHRYAAHDRGRQQTAERVEWTETRNLNAAPEHAYKLMINTARNQNELKKASGQRVGRPTKDGPVLHVVMAPDEDEPQDEQSLKAAANELLAKLGKTKTLKSGKRRQFADEHEVVMYAHDDGKSGTHVHLMINKVHPETGLNLPDGNNYDKAQKWALAYSKKHGTAHKTPAREENRADRDRGDYVKHPDRMPKNVYELEKKLKAKVANDRDPLQHMRANQKRKDHRLFQIGRSLKSNQLAAEASLQDQLKRDIQSINTQIREEWRPLHRALEAKQRQERKTFSAMEASFFGRMGNTVKSIGQAFQANHKNMIGRGFKIARNAADRQATFDAAQERVRQTLQRQRDQAEHQEAERLKTDHRAKLAANSAFFQGKHDRLQEFWAKRREQRAKEVQKLHQLLKTREKAKAVTPPVKKVFNRVARALPRVQSSGDDQPISLQKVANYQAKPTPANISNAPSPEKTLSSKASAFGAQQRSKRGTQAFKEAMRRPASEQDNDRERFRS